METKTIVAILAVVSVLSGILYLLGVPTYLLVFTSGARAVYFYNLPIPMLIFLLYILLGAMGSFAAAYGLYKRRKWALKLVGAVASIDVLASSGDIISFEKNALMLSEFSQRFGQAPISSQEYLASGIPMVLLSFIVLGLWLMLRNRKDYEVKS